MQTMYNKLQGEELISKIAEYIDDCKDAEDNLHAIQEKIDSFENDIVRLQKENLDYQTQINHQVATHASNNNTNDKINAREYLLANDKDYQSILNSITENSLSLKEYRESKSSSENTKKQLMSSYEIAVDTLQDYTKKLMLDEPEIETSFVIVTNHEEDLIDAINYIADTFYDYKDANFYNHRKSSSNKDTFYAFILYVLGTRSVKKSKDLVLTPDFNTVNKQKANELILVHQTLLSNREHRMLGLNQLVELGILTKEEKINIINDE